MGDALASRDLMQGLRDLGVATGGPSPMRPRDRSRFLAKLDDVVNAVMRRSNSELDEINVVVVGI